MKNSYFLADAIISPLGFTTATNLEALKNSTSGLKKQPASKFAPSGFYSGIIKENKLDGAFKEIGDPSAFTKLEKMMLLAVAEVLNNSEGLDISSAALVVSTTKGNIDLLQKDKKNKRIYLHELAEVIRRFFGFKENPVVISNACISGGLAASFASRLIKAGKFENVIVVAGDLVSDFVVSGFNSFQALSSEACKPFSTFRNGISLGEAAAAVLISSKKAEKGPSIELLSDSVTNDANHISGPSRTGEGLFLSIKKSLKEAGITSKEIDYISAHGTGTLYNDEMEAIAFHRAGLEKVPVNSFKGVYGHTLGAAALLETIITKHSLLQNTLFPSVNSEDEGVSKPLNLIKKYEILPLKYALKTASGFGGCNLSLILKKEEDE